MKAFTDISQSRKLAEILPLESADMIYIPIMDIDSMSNSGFFDIPECYPFNEFKDNDTKPLPCWSLAALLEQIPSDLGSSTLTIEKCDSEPFKYGLNYHDRWGREDDIQTKYYDDLVDACYEMIINLKEII